MLRPGKLAQKSTAQDQGAYIKGKRKRAPANHAIAFETSPDTCAPRPICSHKRYDSTNLNIDFIRLSPNFPREWVLLIQRHSRPKTDKDEYANGILDCLFSAGSSGLGRRGGAQERRSAHGTNYSNGQ